MSHFSVLVVTPEYPTEAVLEKILLPYHEYECTGIEQYLQFVPADMDELNKEFAERDDKSETFEQWIDGWSGDKQNDQGIWGRWTNPDKKWDWWTVGGRYSNRLVVGNHPNDIAQKSACNWDAMALQRQARRIAGWTEASNNADFNDERKRHEFFYGIPADADRDTYVNTDPGFQCFALLNSDGWHEKSKMHWFAIHDENPEWPAEFRRLFDSIPDDHYLAVVDCHI